MADAHLLGVCICIVCPGGAVFGTGHLIGSWFLTAQGYMLDWLGDVTSTVISVNLQGCVLSDKSICIIACFVWVYWTYEMCKMCILYCFLSDFCPCLIFQFVFVPCINLLYTTSVYHPCICVCLPLCLLICQVWSHSELSARIDQYFR